MKWPGLSGLRIMCILILIILTWLWMTMPQSYLWSFFILVSVDGMHLKLFFLIQASDWKISIWTDSKRRSTGPAGSHFFEQIRYCKWPFRESSCSWETTYSNSWNIKWCDYTGRFHWSQCEYIKGNGRVLGTRIIKPGDWEYKYEQPIKVSWSFTFFFL